MVPVRGLFAPTESLPEEGALVPERSPGAKTSLLNGPRGSHPGGTSSATIREVRALPPRRAYFSGRSSNLTSREVMLRRRILDTWISLLNTFMLSLFRAISLAAEKATDTVFVNRSPQ